MSKWEKRYVWVVTVWLADKDEDGEDINWSSPSEEHYADTYEQAVIMREQFLAGKDEYYGNLVEDCTISDEPEKRELLKR